jgi:hypothetical protein
LWKQKNVKYPLFGELASRISAVDARCGEAVTDFPNSTEHGDEYVTFLIECATDFRRAIGQRDRVDAMETGKSFAIDICFKAMMRSYPLYLKKGILTTKGELVKRNVLSSGNASMSAGESSGGGSGSSSDGEGLVLDAAVEDSIGRRLLFSSRTRLAVQSAVQDRKLDANLPLMIYVAWSAVVSMFFAVFLFAYFERYFDHRFVAYERERLAGAARMHLGLSVTAGLVDWNMHVGLFNGTELKAKIYPAN